METITIQVDSDIAQAYYAANEVKRQKLQALITAFLQPIPKPDALTEIIAEMQEQAAKNGLTQALLDEILQDD